MTQFLRSSDPDFAKTFEALVQARRDQPADVQEAVRSIIEEVKGRGDAALIELTARFDHLDLRDVGIAVRPEELEAAYNGLAPDLKAALTIAHQRIEAHHRRYVPTNERYADAIGAELGHRWTPIDSVGLYVPGGKASYPSSVLMNAVPARVAGVPRIVMVAPTPRGEVNPAVLAAAHLAGVTEVYRIGGAQAVAALAYGTETIKPVVKIVGPGNAYVAEAKRRVFGTVGIDSIAGPSEVVVVADGEADPRWVAADLLAQAEHDEAAQSILITDSAALAQTTASAVDQQLASMPRGPIAAKSWKDHGAILLVVRPCQGSAASGERARARTSGTILRRRRRHAARDPQRGSHFHRPLHAGSSRRLCGRIEPCAADDAYGALLLRPGRPRFHEAHVASEA